MSALPNQTPQPRSLDDSRPGRVIGLVKEPPSSAVPIAATTDRMRRLAAQHGNDELLDEAWSVLVDCLVVREGLDQACRETQVAISAILDRLGTLKLMSTRAEQSLKPGASVISTEATAIHAR